MASPPRATGLRQAWLQDQMRVVRSNSERLRQAKSGRVTMVDSVQQSEEPLSAPYGRVMRELEQLAPDSAREEPMPEPERPEAAADPRPRGYDVATQRVLAHGNVFAHPGAFAGAAMENVDTSAAAQQQPPEYARRGGS